MLTTRRLFKLPTAAPTAWQLSMAALLAVSAVAAAPTVATLLESVHRYLTAETPRLVYAPTPENEQLLARCEAIQTYYPLWYLFNGHLQTVKLAHANDQQLHPAIAYERQLLEMPDGGVVSLDWALPPQANGTQTPLVDIDPRKRTALLLPGLTGGSSEHYIRSAVQQLHARGWQAVVLNARGCANTPLLTPQFFCIAYTDDLRFVVTHLAKTYAFQTEAFVAIGFSLGSNVLVKYLGEDKVQTPLTAAVSIGNPFDVVACSRNIDATLFNRLTYGRALNTSLLQLVFEKSNAHTVFADYPGVDIAALRRATSLYDFDDRFTRVLFRYASVQAFYTDASCVSRLAHVAVPLLCLNAADDPISITIPSDATIVSNPNVILCVTQAGGHLAFFEGPQRRRQQPDGVEGEREANSSVQTWSSRVLAEFADSVWRQRIEQSQQQQTQT